MAPLLSEGKMEGPMLLGVAIEQLSPSLRSGSAPVRLRRVVSPPMRTGLRTRMGPSLQKCRTQFAIRQLQFAAPAGRAGHGAEGI